MPVKQKPENPSKVPPSAVEEGYLIILHRSLGAVIIPPMPHAHPFERVDYGRWVEYGRESKSEMAESDDRRKYDFGALSVVRKAKA